MTDHDRLFKELLSTFFMEFLELFLPELALQVEPESVRFLPQEYFADLTSGEKKIIDLLAQVKLSGQDAGILIHVEAQASSKPDFTRRIFFYFARLYQKYLQHVYPVVIFSFDEPLREEPHTHSVEIADLKVLEFNFAAIQLNRLNWRDYLNQRNPVAAALMAKMKIASGDRAKVKAECLRVLATLQLNPAKVELISGFVDTYLRLSAQEEEIFQAEIGKLEETDREGVMQIVTSWMERGIEQGIEQGIERGLQHERSLILRLLNRRVGTIASEAEAQIRSLSLAQLEALGEALLDFSQPSDLSAWLRSHS
ncbi:Rpn family recombination-promoting nuclease/putative transposase [Altericista sp. CCNU0014]|uniref:Rpn family recombination-promoting nuclease/putative transposase n=1 Tax=Altericista sp. CCNU0014 TaxID=3082949 RepID=UPI003850A7C4